MAMDKIIHHLKKSRHILIASHVNPDGDAVGSLIAMGLALTSVGKHTTLYNESKIPTVYRFLPSVDRIVSNLETLSPTSSPTLVPDVFYRGKSDGLVRDGTWKSEPGNSELAYDTAVILDCGDLERIGELRLETRNSKPCPRHLSSGIEAQNLVPDIFHRGSKLGSSFQFPVPTLINIDHHITNTRFGDLHLIDPSACATAEIVYRLIKKMGIPIDKAMATSIYTAILTDTGSFRFSNTNKAAFEICDKMVALGVDPYYVAKNVYGKYSLGRIKLLNLALDSIEISPNGRLSMMTVTQDMLDETATQHEDVDGLINYARRIEDVKVAVLIQECRNGKRGQGSELRAQRSAPEVGREKREFHVSLRSDGSADVAEIAARHGGGGHYTAAGFNIESSMSDLKSGMLRLAKELGN